MQTQTLSANPRGTNYARYLKSLILGKNGKHEALAIASQWRDSPSVELTLKSIVEAMDTSAALAAYGIASEVLEFVNGASVFGRLTNFMHPMRLRVPTPIISALPSSSWVGEAGAKPISRPTFGSNLTLEAYNRFVLSSSLKNWPESQEQSVRLHCVALLRTRLRGLLTDNF
jgi:hypothetical protein